MVRIAIIVIVDDHPWIAMVAQRTPAVVIDPMIPGHPRRPPVTGRDPVPAQAKAPLPPSVVVNAPAPGIIGDPGPSTDRIPQPASVTVRSPGIVVDMGDPYVPVWLFVDPASVVVQFRFILIKFFWEIGTGIRAVMIGFAAPIPFVKTAAVAGVGPGGPIDDPSLRGPQLFAGLDHFRAVFCGGLDLSLDNFDLGLTVFIHSPTVETDVQDVERRVWRVELEILLHGVHPQKDLAFQQVEPHLIVAAAGKSCKLDLRVIIQP